VVTSQINFLAGFFMKYILEIDVAESEKSFAKKFFKNIPFVKKVKEVASTENKSANNLNKSKGKQSITDFSGAISENDYQALKEHSEQARKEWNRVI